MPELRSVFGEQVILGYSILIAIPVVIYNLIGEHLWRSLQVLERHPENRIHDLSTHRENTLRSVRMWAIAVMGLELLIYFTNTVMRTEHPLIAVGIFLAMIFAQSQIQMGIEKRIKKSDEKTLGKVKAGAKSGLWLGLSVFIYFFILNTSVLTALILGKLVGLSEAGLVVAVIAGCGVGVLFGLFMTYLLSPLYLSKLLPATPLKEGRVFDLVGRCFDRANTPLPDLWLVDTEDFRWNNAMVAGFGTPKFGVRPAMFIARALVDKFDQSELEAIVLHEASHLSMRHLEKRMVRTFVALCVSILLSGGVFFTLIQTVPAQGQGWVTFLALAIAIFTPFKMVRNLVNEQEFEADYHCVGILGAKFEALESTLRKLDQLNNQTTTSNGQPTFAEARIQLLRKRLTMEGKLAPKPIVEEVDQKKAA